MHFCEILDPLKKVEKNTPSCFFFFFWLFLFFFSWTAALLLSDFVDTVVGSFVVD